MNKTCCPPLAVLQDLLDQSPGAAGPKMSCAACFASV